MTRLSRKNVQASLPRKITPEPCASCSNPDASGPVCTACRYPRFIHDPAARYPGIGCTRCLNLNLERLDSEHCNRCRRTWPGYMAPAAN